MKPQESQEQLTHTLNGLCLNDDVNEWANQFYLAKKVEGVSTFTLIFYKQQLRHFLRYCEGQAITHLHELTANHIRHFMTWHEETGHNPGGLHAAFRVVRTFLLWYEDEIEPVDWRNPIHKVKAPKLAIEPLDPVSLNDVSQLVNKCGGGKFLELRDKALLLFLLDTGARAREVLRVNLDDINLLRGEVLIRQGKGRKPRLVYLGKASRKAMRVYLKIRKDASSAVWVSDEGERLTYGGLRGIITRRAKQTGIPNPSLHSFRRAFALAMLRNGTNIFVIQKLMGHSDIQVLRRYLAQTDNDLMEAHKHGSPVDNSF